MSHLAIARLFVFGTLLFLLAGHLAEAQQKPGWTWKDKAGATHPKSELDDIIRQHEKWLESGGKSGSQAILDGADLRGADLMGVLLNGANLIGANLNKAHLVGAHLNGADLAKANLTDASLPYADLTHAKLLDSVLTNTVFEDAWLTLVEFEPKSLPSVREIAAAKYLELLTYDDDPDALFQLRKRFQDGGFRKQEREITYAIKRRETERSWEACKSRTLGKDKTRAILWSSDSNLANCGAFVLNRVFFDLPCQYGMSPGRPLSLGILVWLLCSLLYFACIRTSGKAGLYRIYNKTIAEDPPTPERVERILVHRSARKQGLARFFQVVRRDWLVLRASMFFSLMSAFNIGFRDINFGRWLRMLTRQDFDIKAVGWARVVAGWQSLISVYLLALWVLTEFSRPFG